MLKVIGLIIEIIWDFIKKPGKITPKEVQDVKDFSKAVATGDTDTIAGLLSELKNETDRSLLSAGFTEDLSTKEKPGSTDKQ